jgi:hypothetical protein
VAKKAVAKKSKKKVAKKKAKPAPAPSGITSIMPAMPTLGGLFGGKTEDGK